jgi:Flp pilus assembly pilin Flp
MLKTIQSWGQKVLAFKKAYVEGRSGATAIEYGLIAAGIAITIVNHYDLLRMICSRSKHLGSDPLWAGPQDTPDRLHNFYNRIMPPRCNDMLIVSGMYRVFRSLEQVSALVL